MQLTLYLSNSKVLPGLMSLDFYSDIQIAGSEFGINNKKAWIHLVLIGQAAAGNMEDILFTLLGSLRKI